MIYLKINESIIRCVLTIPRSFLLLMYHVTATYPCTRHYALRVFMFSINGESFVIPFLRQKYIMTK